jgi:hypothetical protein
MRWETSCPAQGRPPARDGARIGTKPLRVRYASKIHVMQGSLVSKTTFFIASLVLASAQGALAADQKQCADQFKAADLNISTMML